VSDKRKLDYLFKKKEFNLPDLSIISKVHEELVEEMVIP
jgi:hypothetical protein